jgi:hypothetical protein
MLAGPANAQAPKANTPEHLVEIWQGAEATEHNWSAYAGATLAPFASLGANGFRIRAVSGAGRYRYRRTTARNGVGVEQTFTGQSIFTDGLVGYHYQIGPWTLKAFLGATYVEQRLHPFDPLNRVTGTEFGIKGMFETWYNFNDRIWAALDLSFATTHKTYQGRLRVGQRIGNGISLGAETGAYGNAEFDGARAGAFIRYEWASGEINLSGGVSGDIAEPVNPYGAITVLQRF